MNKRTSRVAPLVLGLLLTSSGLAQGDQKLAPNFEIPAKGTKGWKPTKMTLAELGRRMDAAMKALKYTAHQSLITYEEGSTKKNGRMITTTRIQSPSMFSIEFP